MLPLSPQDSPLSSVAMPVLAATIVSSACPRNGRTTMDAMAFSSSPLRHASLRNCTTPPRYFFPAPVCSSRLYLLRMRHARRCLRVLNEAIRILIAGDGAAYEGAGCVDLLYEFAPSARRDPHSGPTFSCFACRFAAPGVQALPEPDNLRYFKVLIEGAALDPRPVSS